jgi:hypothetical protein
MSAMIWYSAGVMIPFCSFSRAMSIARACQY